MSMLGCYIIMILVTIKAVLVMFNFQEVTDKDIFIAIFMVGVALFFKDGEE